MTAVHAEASSLYARFLEALDTLPERTGYVSLPFYRGPLHGQTLTVFGYVDVDGSVSVPPLLWHYEPDRTQHAYKLLLQDALAENRCCPIYVCDRSFPAPADAPAT